MRKKVGDFCVTNCDDYIIKYLHKHYNIYDKYVTPKIHNFYDNHKKFTRFVLVSISIEYALDNIKEDDIKKLLDEYKFNQSLEWQIEHIVPRSQRYNQFNHENSKLINNIGNLALLTKDTNTRISNKSFYQKRQGISHKELELKVNEVFQIDKVNISKIDIREREQVLNSYIFDIFIKDNGDRLRRMLEKIEDYY
ncbi:HNH endonuclease [Streptococcus sp. sy010]|nr:HNH endonuclease [Streptococcus sp. sy010]